MNYILRYGTALCGLLVPVLVIASFLFVGTPHLALQYTFLDNGDEWNVATPRHYTSCTYYGWTGSHRIAARGGDCPWVRFLRSGVD